MPNTTNVYRGSDATITLSKTEGAEGDAAQGFIETFQLSPVGRATNVEVCVQTELELFHEIGKRHPAALRPGNINISGKIGRAYINGALLSLLLGKGAAVTRENEPYAQPSFDIQLLLSDPAVPDTTNTLTIHGAKFENWSYSLPEDDFVMEAVSFKGMFITVEDKP